MAASLLRVMLDLCCIKRLYDEARSERIRLEAEAVELLLAMHDRGAVRIVATPSLVAENARNPELARRTRAARVLADLDWFVPPRDLLNRRVARVARSGVAGFDAVHIASAELAGASHFLSTDDRLLARTTRAPAKTVTVAVRNPVHYLEEVAWEQSPRSK